MVKSDVSKIYKLTQITLKTEQKLLKMYILLNKDVLHEY